MELWSEYEGRTIDGVFPLTKLLQPEGRSAFFSTPNGSGRPTVIRLIESHFDDDRIVARWRGVAALNHPNLVKLKKFGKVEMDGAPLVYGVMEPADGNLGEIVGVRRLTMEETREVAESLVAALGALHENGFVHEHVEPGSVLAVGEKIKLRSDCIRETPEGEEGVAARRRDVRDLAAVLLRSLTQRRTLEEAKRELPLPAPFDAIVRNGLNESWGLKEISAALAPDASPVVAANSVEPAAAAVVTVADEEDEDSAAAAMPAKSLMRAQEKELPLRAGTSVKILLGIGVVVVVLIGWRMVHSSSPARSAALESASTTVAEASSLPRQPLVEQKPSAIAGATDVAKSSASSAAGASAVSASSTSVGTHVEWRVIAFTYNHEDQAKTKAERLAAKHPELKPEVFTPNGRAPYLVSIGGAMERADAYQFARKERSEGLAGDVYAQNFKVAGASQ